MARILTLTLNPALDLTVRLARLEPGEVNRSETMLTHAAGKGVNVAQVLADLGHQVTVGGFLGADNPQAFDALIARRGFADAFIRVPGETRSNIKIAEQDGRVTDINAPGPLVSEQAQQALLNQLTLIAPGHDAVVVAGSLPCGVSPQWFQGLLVLLKDLGLKVALDTSGAALRAGLQAGPWLIKPNTEELAEALDSPDRLRPPTGPGRCAFACQRHRACGDFPRCRRRQLVQPRHGAACYAAESQRRQYGRRGRFAAGRDAPRFARFRSARDHLASRHGDCRDGRHADRVWHQR